MSSGGPQQKLMWCVDDRSFASAVVNIRRYFCKVFKNFLCFINWAHLCEPKEKKHQSLTDGVLIDFFIFKNTETCPCLKLQTQKHLQKSSGKAKHIILCASKKDNVAFYNSAQTISVNWGLFTTRWQHKLLWKLKNERGKTVVIKDL